MKKRRVIFAPEARDDLAEIEGWLLGSVSDRTADAFIRRILGFCHALETAAERGHRRNDIRQGTRIVGFERRMTIAFAVHTETVEILRIFRSGRDWETELSDD